MSLEALRQALPAYAKDIAANLAALADADGLAASRTWGCFLACAHAVGQVDVVRAIEAEAARRLTAEVREAAKTAAAEMALANLYHRATHLMSNPEYRALPTHLRLNALTPAGAPKADMELWRLAVSAVHGCGACLDAHEAKLRALGVGVVEIQTALRIAATVHAAGRVLAAARAAS
jgi:alkyl hydroperoxide reductase subunit D